MAENTKDEAEIEIWEKEKKIPDVQFAQHLQLQLL